MDALSERAWSRLQAEIGRARDTHVATHHDRLAEVIGATGDHYGREVRDLVEVLRGSGLAAPFVAPLLERLVEYLGWMQWVAWNSANLIPVFDDERRHGPHRLALATLAYVGGRLIDDGLDAHTHYKAHRLTLVGWMTRSAPPLPLEQACARSSFIGLCAYQHSVTRLRATGEEPVARLIERLFERISAGITAEWYVPRAIDRAVYDTVVRRKAVAYNMILHRSALASGGGRQRIGVLRALAEMDAIAQLINDFRDVPDDRRRGSMNAFTCGAYEYAAFPALLQNRMARAWSRMSALPPDARNAIAAMYQNLGAPLFQSRRDLSRESLPREPPSDAVLSAAIANGLSYLETTQRPSGEIPTYCATDRRLAEAVHHESPFVTALVVLALSRVEGATTTLIGRAASYLSSWRRPDGTVCFLRQGMDPDLDDTSLLNWVTQRHLLEDVDYAALARRIAGVRREAGLFVTWLRPGDACAAGNDVDPCVTVNVVRFLAANGVPCGDSLRALRHAIDCGAYQSGTLYYDAPASLPYLAASLPAALRLQIGEPAEWAAWATRLVERCDAGRAEGVLDAAMTLASACVACLPVSRTAPLAAALLAHQTCTGSWPRQPAFRAYGYWGSAALTTALAVEALSLFRTARELV